MPLPDAELGDALGRSDLPPSIERWRVELAPGASRPTSAAEWAGCLVLVESGVLEVHCAAGGHRSFGPGDILALEWVPVVRLRNPGALASTLLAVRRQGPSPPAGQGPTDRGSMRVRCRRPPPPPTSSRSSKAIAAS